MLRAMKYQSIISRYLSPSFPAWSARNQRHFFSVPHIWRKTLFNSHSLTAQLIALSDGDFSVRVLWQGWRQITPQEAQLLNCESSDTTAWCRDVALQVKGEPWVYARTCMPKSSLTGYESQLLNLGDKPLGGFLFTHPHMSRGKMNAFSLKHNPLSLQWARRSVFYLNQKPILVTEAFTRPLTNPAR